MTIEKNKLFVGNLDGRVRWYHLKEFFWQYGSVAYTKVVYDRETKRSRWFGFVLFDNEQDASKAIEELNGKPLVLPGADFGDRELRLMYAESKEEVATEQETSLVTE